MVDRRRCLAEWRDAAASDDNTVLLAVRADDLCGPSAWTAAMGIENSAPRRSCGLCAPGNHQSASGAVCRYGADRYLAFGNLPVSCASCQAMAVRPGFSCRRCRAPDAALHGARSLLGYSGCRTSQRE